MARRSAHRQSRADLERQVRRGYQLAGPVVTVQGLRCDCGAIMRPGVDHLCAAPPPAELHRVQIRHGSPAACSCGWTSSTAYTPGAIAAGRGHLRSMAKAAPMI